MQGAESRGVAHEGRRDLAIGPHRCAYDPIAFQSGAAWDCKSPRPMARNGAWYIVPYELADERAS